MARLAWFAWIAGRGAVIPMVVASAVVLMAPQSGAAAEPAVTAARAGDDALRQQQEALRLDAMRADILGPNRANRLAAWQIATAGGDETTRRLANETALDSRDPILGNLVLRGWLSRQRTIPVLLYATREDPASVPVLQYLGPLTLKTESFDPANGAVVANMGAPGYDVTRASTAVGSLAQTTLTLNTYGCQLALQLTEHRTLDGLYRCRTLPALVARIVLD